MPKGVVSDHGQPVFLIQVSFRSLTKPLDENVMTHISHRFFQIHPADSWNNFLRVVSKSKKFSEK